MHFDISYGQLFHMDLDNYIYENYFIEIYIIFYISHE